ncbi:MAG TPA: DNA alkylation repair protein [Candidatus Limnocylindrales bacterium]|nr:DNA alkylation repair protein [Candidatus Limnocylindrales bacterium]
MNDALTQIRQDLQASADPQTRKTFQRFFKEQVKYYGVKTPTVGKIAKKYWKQVKVLDKQGVFKLCEELFRSDYTEEAFVVAFWLPNYLDRLEPSDMATFRGWIERYVNNWAKCDSFCNHTIGDLIQKYPEIISEIKNWAKNNNRWLKRAAAVSLIVPAKTGRFLHDAFEICDVLLVEEDDMVQKGYGWLLKEESRKHQKDVYDYVIEHKSVMPRTALRYAIELMPKELRKLAMEKPNP